METTTTLVRTFRRRHRVCVGCKNVLDDGLHDCIKDVRHPNVARLLVCLQLGLDDLVRAHYHRLPERERPTVAAILDHADTAVPLEGR